ncbi:protein TolA [Paracoccus sp. 1_MG-2023]|uniref:protein TolA n=1 Tax=unclassified Paracoccus (in: a-proteobacteria) TaxID=2688777 RepID=UPI001C09E156|nr:MULTISPECIES: protein TolA [unclassified Paracoccus (in: a-proteobacteria)]MBU2957524.1 protein TolA [Paracoccus sp. C2R09]MDO6669816.1 protein TolA [Paracoccus sp. 1_MG-2023]
MADRDERIGWWVSGGVHGALLVALILGGALFRPQPGPGTRSTQVSTISGAEFEALAAAARGSGPVGANATDIDQMTNPAEPEAEAARPAPASPPATDDAAELSAPDRSEPAPDLSDFEPRDPVAVTTDLPDPTAPATPEALPDLPRATDAPQTGRSAAVPVAPAPDEVAEPVAPRSALALDQSRNPQSRPDGLVEAYRQRQAEAAAAEAAAAAQREAAAEAARAEAARAEAARAEAARAEAAQQAADAQAEAQAEARAQAEAEAEAQRRAAAEEAEAREAAEAAEARQRAEEERQAAEAERRAEEERRATEAAQAERRAEEAAEAERRAEAERQAAEAERRAEEERRAAEAAEAAEEERRAEAERRAEEERRAAEAAEAERRAEEERRAAEAAETAEEERRAEAERRAEEERRAAEAAEADRQALEDALREAQGAGGGADGTDTAAGADAFGDSQSIEGGSGASAEMDPLAAALAGAMSAGSGTEDAGGAAPAAAPNQLVPGDIRPSTLPDPSQQGALPLGDPLSQSERDELRFAIHDCWNKGLLSVEASQMTVSVGVRLSPEGIPEQDSLRMAGYRGGSEGAAQQAFEIASRAILMCGRAGFDLPMSKYGRWRDIVVDFRPDGVEF